MPFVRLIPCKLEVAQHSPSDLSDARGRTMRPVGLSSDLSDLRKNSPYVRPKADPSDLLPGTSDLSSGRSDVGGDTF